jgi:ribosome-associated protein
MPKIAMHVTPTLSIDESEIRETFVLSSGPGGQNVNKVASAVQLRFDAAHSPSLQAPVRQRLMRAAGSRLTKDGIIVLTCRRFRDQVRNREQVREMLAEMVRQATVVPKARHKTRPPRSAKERRLADKKIRTRLKAERAKPAGEYE